MLTPNKHQAGVVPDKQDVIHFVIAPEIGQFDQLGHTIEERLAAYKNAIRESSHVSVESTWLAAIHLNTGIAHAHVTISQH